MRRIMNLGLMTGCLALVLTACGGSKSGGGGEASSSSDPSGSPGPGSSNPSGSSDPAGSEDPSDSSGTNTYAGYPQHLEPLDANCEKPAQLADTSSPDHVIGTGTPESCHEDDLQAAVTAGGVITFDCGNEPHTIKLTKTITLEGERNNVPDVTIDGGRKITLDGQSKVRILSLPHWFDRKEPRLQVQRLAFVNGRSTGSPHPYGLGTDTDGGGGAIYFRGGTLVVVDCVFRDNVGPAEGPDVAGGAISGLGFGEMLIVDSTFENNACSNGGAIGSLFPSMQIVNSVIKGNKATGYGANNGSGENQTGRGGNGGGIAMDGRGDLLHICGTRIEGNSAGAVGAAMFRTGYDKNVSKDGQSVVTIDQASITGNSSSRDEAKGAVYLQGTLNTITDTLIANNVYSSQSALWLEKHPGAPATLDLVNVTLWGNRSEGFGVPVLTLNGGGGGSLQNVTIANNEGVKLHVGDLSGFTVNNSIFALPKCKSPGRGSNNLQWPDGGEPCVRGINYRDPQLQELADNGGPTMTVAPASGSPAIGAGANCASHDQRNIARSGACTIGAFEVE